MSSSRTRAGWEASAAKKYGLHLDRDSAFFDKAWELGEFDTARHSYDEDYDPLVRNWAIIWKEARGSDEVGSGYMREAVSSGVSPGRGRESIFGGPAEPTVELNAVDSARQWAITEYLHKTAALERDVMLFRSEVFGAPHKTLSRSEALHRLEEAEISQGRIPDVPVTSVAMPEGDFGRRFRVPEESAWGRLSRLAGMLSRKYPWDEAQAAAFVMCGDSYSDDGSTTAFTPPVVRVGSRKSLSKGHAAHPYNRTVITMEVASWVPAEQVEKAYTKMQSKLNGGRSQRRPSLRNIKVFSFVLSNARVKVVKAEEHLARLVLPPWRDLREAWDDGYPPGHAWHYGTQNIRNFRRDFGLGQAVVLSLAGGGLLGIRGEPRTPTQQLEYLRSRAGE